MSLPKTLKLAQERLETAEESLQLHAEELRQTLTEERTYRGLYEDETASKAARATTQAFNARQQFSTYQRDFQEAINYDGKVPEEIMNEHDIPANTDQYRKAFNTAEQVALRHQRLHNQIKGLSQVMEQNGLGNLWKDIEEEFPWYRRPEEVDDTYGFPDPL